VTDFRSAPQEFGRPFFDETADAFSRVFRGLQPALLLLQLSRGDDRPFERGFPRIGQGRANASGACWLIRVAISIARWRSLPGATTSWMNPSLKAVSAVNSSPVKRYRKALPRPAGSVIRMVAPAEGMIPCFTSICAKRQSEAATTMSDANINSIPSVKQMPWTAETKGLARMLPCGLTGSTLSAGNSGLSAKCLAT
jgi:hypothetical protein